MLTLLYVSNAKNCTAAYGKIRTTTTSAYCACACAGLHAARAEHSAKKKKQRILQEYGEWSTCSHVALVPTKETFPLNDSSQCLRYASERIVRIANLHAQRSVKSTALRTHDTVRICMRTMARSDAYAVKGFLAYLEENLHTFKWRDERF
jgi:hypothetical protein